MSMLCSRLKQSPLSFKQFVRRLDLFKSTSEDMNFLNSSCIGIASNQSQITTGKVFPSLMYFIISLSTTFDPNLTKIKNKKL